LQDMDKPDLILRPKSSNKRMKYINLLPSELRAKPKNKWQKTRLTSKLLFVCLIVPGLIFGVIYGGMLTYDYHRKFKIEEDIAPSATTQSKKHTVPLQTNSKLRGNSKKTIPYTKEEKTKARIAALDKKAVSTVEKTSSMPDYTRVTHAEQKTSGYTLHLETFTNLAKAEAIILKMKQRDLQAFQEQKQVSQKTNTVYVTPSSTMENAMELSKRLEADGFESFIKIRQQGAYGVGVKSLPSLIMAEKLAERLKQLGYQPNIVQEQVTLTLYQVNYGHYADYSEAKSAQKIMENQGYHITSIIRDTHNDYN
jgi:cell division septation protein DedD